jgi:chemotaxis protein MotB
MCRTGGNTGEAQLWLPTHAALCMAFLVCCLVLLAGKGRPQGQARTRIVAMQTQTFNDIRAFIALNGMEAGVEALLEETSITLRLAADTLFAPGTEQMLPTGLNTLNLLKDIFIIHNQQTINIRGYTDDKAPPTDARFRDNWELSALRAARILRHLLACGIEPERLTATGFGELEPLFPNTLEENRAKNRRIEFVLERHPGKE